MAFVVLFSTLSFSVNKHYCGEMLFSKTLFFQAQDCGMQQMYVCGDDNTSSQSVKNNGCCHNETLLIKGQNLEQKAITATNLDIQKIAVIPNFNILSFEDIYQKKPTFYKNYSPPLLVKNIPVLVQSFLI